VHHLGRGSHGAHLRITPPRPARFYSAVVQNLIQILVKLVAINIVFTGAKCQTGATTQSQSPVPPRPSRLSGNKQRPKKACSLQWSHSPEYSESGDTATIKDWFDSALGPPIEAYNTFKEENEDCSIQASYYEPNMDWFPRRWC
jgi:hypothetical protein